MKRTLSGKDGAKGPAVGIVMGSDSDWALVSKAAETLAEFGVEHEARVISAHRTPAMAAEYAKTARGRGLKVIIAAAGGAAHLAGVIASHTTLPVIGIPIESGALHGMDALLATVQMPAGVPVASVALGSSGPVNAALFAVQILASGDDSLGAALLNHKENLRKKVGIGDARVRQSLVDMAKARAERASGMA